MTILVPVTPAKAEPFSIMVADPHLLVAESLCAFLSTELPCEARHVDSLEGAIQAFEGSRFDLFLYDCPLPGSHCLADLQTIVSTFPDTGVVLFGTCNDASFLSAALRIGLRGYVPKTMPLKSLPPTLRLLKTGEVYVPPAIFKELNSRVEKEQAVKPLFAPTEVAMFRMIESGMSNKEIGAQIGVTENRVKTILRGLYQKIDARNRVHAVAIAQKLGAI